MRIKRTRIVIVFLLFIYFSLLSCATEEETVRPQQLSEGINLEFVGNRIDLRNPLPRNGEEVEVIVTVRNLGNQQARRIPVSFYDNHMVFFTAEIDLEPGKQYGVIAGWRATTGNHVLSVIIDPTRQFKGTVRENNKVERAVLVR